MKLKGGISGDGISASGNDVERGEEDKGGKTENGRGGNSEMNDIIVENDDNVNAGGNTQNGTEILKSCNSLDGLVDCGEEEKGGNVEIGRGGNSIMNIRGENDNNGDAGWDIQNDIEKLRNCMNMNLDGFIENPGDDLVELVREEDAYLSD